MKGLTSLTGEEDEEKQGSREKLFSCPLDSTIVFVTVDLWSICTQSHTKFVTRRRIGTWSRPNPDGMLFSAHKVASLREYFGTFNSATVCEIQKMSAAFNKGWIL